MNFGYVVMMSTFIALAQGGGGSKEDDADATVNVTKKTTITNNGN